MTPQPILCTPSRAPTPSSCPILDSQPLTAVNGNNHGEAFYRVGSNAPHNLYSNVANLAKLSTSKAAPNPLFAYLGTGQAFGGFGASAGQPS